MAMHYFHMANDHTMFDSVGTDLPDLQSVRKETLRAGREMLNLGGSEPLWAGEPWRVWVTDEPDGSGQTILTSNYVYGEDRSCPTSRRAGGQRFGVAGVPPNRASYRK